MLLEDDTDDLEFHPPQTNRYGAGSWQRRQQHYAFNEALAPDPNVDRIRDGWDKGNLFEEGGDDWFKTRAGVGLDDVNGEFDVAKTETLLEQTGVLDLAGTKGPTGIFSYGKQDAIKNFQAGNKLQIDGVIKPNGETMRALKTQLTPKLNTLAAAAKGAEAERAAPVAQEKFGRVSSPPVAAYGTYATKGEMSSFNSRLTDNALICIFKWSLEVARRSPPQPMLPACGSPEAQRHRG